MKDDLAFFLYLYLRIKEEEIDDIHFGGLLSDIKELSSISMTIHQVREQLENLNSAKLRLEAEIKELKSRINNFDGTMSSLTVKLV